MADDFLKQKLDELRTRLRELQPMHEEYLRIEKALRSLEGGTTSASTSASTSAPRQRGRRGPGRPRGSKTKRTGGSRGGARKQRARSGGTRAEHAARVVAENPGVAVPEIAKQLKIKPNYVYRVMSNLQKEGVVRKRGKAYYPSAGAAGPSAGTKKK